MNSIKLYTDSHLDIEVQYKNESTCSTVEQERTKLQLSDYSNLLYPTEIQSQYFASISNDRVNHLAEHVVAVDKYNRNYLFNKTASLQEMSRSVVLTVVPPTVITINSTLMQLNASFSTLLKCVSLNEASSESCSYN